MNLDLKLLEYALEQGYGGRDFVPPEDWARMKAALRQLQGRPSTVQKSCDAVADVLWLLPDAHLSVRRETLGDNSQHRCGPNTQAVRRQAAVGPNYGAEDTRPWVADTLSSGHATLGVIAFKSFPLSGDPAWSGFEAAMKGMLQTDALLIDLRGNEGGDDTRVRQLARTLLDGPAATGAVRVHRRQTPETFTLWMNALQERRSIEAGGLLPHFQTPYEETKQKREAARAGNLPEYQVIDAPPSSIQTGPNAFKGPVAILVDAACASSCENGLEVLRLHPNARIFGQHTGGFIHFGDVGALWLPRSGIRVGIPTRYNEYAGGKFYEKVGFAPDVSVAPGDNAFDDATAWLLAQVPSFRTVAGSDYVLSETMRQAELQRLSDWGLTVPPGQGLLEKPFTAPFSRRSLVVPQSWLLRRTPRLVFAPALRADLDVLQAVMQRAYGGYAIAEMHGWDWSRWFDAWREELHSIGAKWLPTKQAFEPVRQLQLFQLDNHTTIPLGLRFGAGSRMVVLEGKPAASCTSLRSASGEELPLSTRDPAQQPKALRRFNGQQLEQATSLTFPANRGEVTAVKCGGRWLQAKPVEGVDAQTRRRSQQALSGDVEDRPRFLRLSDDYAYLRLPSFYKENSEIISREQPTWPRSSGKERALIVDLRGNEGGDAALGALEGWFDWKELKPLLAFNKRQGASCLYHALRWGYANFSSSNLTPPLSSGMKDGLQTSLQALMEKDLPGCPAKFESVRAPKPYNRKGVEPRPRRGRPLLLVLVDNECGSDCELMTYVLAQLPEAVVVGTNTYGVMQYIQPGYSVLPNTRLPFRIALGTSDLYGDNRSTDGYGLDVDIVLDGKEAWSKEGLLRLADLLTRPR